MIAVRVSECWYKITYLYVVYYKYIFNHFELADALYTADGSPGELYTSQVFSPLSGKTIGVLSNVYKNGATIVNIVAL